MRTLLIIALLCAPAAAHAEEDPLEVVRKAGLKLPRVVGALPLAFYGARGVLVVTKQQLRWVPLAIAARAALRKPVEGELHEPLRLTLSGGKLAPALPKVEAYLQRAPKRGGYLQLQVDNDQTLQTTATQVLALHKALRANLARARFSSPSFSARGFRGGATSARFAREVKRLKLRRPRPLPRAKADLLIAADRSMTWHEQAALIIELAGAGITRLSILVIEGADGKAQAAAVPFHLPAHQAEMAPLIEELIEEPQEPCD